MKNIIVNNWNFMRVFRLTLGIFIFVQAILMKDGTLAALGGLFTLMSVFNIGCCTSGNCKVPKEKGKKSAAPVIFEEVK